MISPAVLAVALLAGAAGDVSSPGAPPGPAFSGPAPSQPAKTPEPLVIRRLSGPIVLDGLSDEPGWDGATAVSMTMQIPSFGKEPSERSEALIGFDDSHLYVAGRLYDREPERILAPSRKRDYFEPNTDWFGVLVDTFNDKENALGFMTTPSGLRWDGTVFNDAVARSVEQMPVNSSWNEFWDVKCVRTRDGWFCEMRIPFSSLRFQDAGGRVVMGLTVWRFICRKSEIDSFPPISPKYGEMAAWKPSQSREIVLEGVRGENPVYVTPYVLGGYDRTFELDEAETAYGRTAKPAREAGLDVKLGLSRNLTFDATVNTDFAQVEADDQQVNLTRFSLFFPEKRLFFQERASVFDFSFGGYDALFYSRRIGLDEDDRPVRILGGARLVGRVGGWDMGLMDMQTAESDALPSENFGVVRLRRRVLNPYSYVGGMVTSRLGADGSFNEAYGLDGTIRPGGDDYLVYNWAQTFASGMPNRLGSLDSARYRFGWERRKTEGLGVDLSIAGAGKDYDPGIGFETREDYRRYRANILYGWLPGESSPLQSHRIFANTAAYLRNSDGSLESGEFSPGWAFALKSGWAGQVALKVSRESVRETLEFAEGVDIPPGDYGFAGVQAFAVTPSGRIGYSMFMTSAGSFYDGSMVSVTAMPTLVLSPDLSLSGMYEIDRVVFPRRDVRWTAHIVRARLSATFSLKLSAAAFVQYNSAEDTVVANLRVRLNPREGNDLYLVYNEDFNTDRRAYFPLRPFSNTRAVMLKYSYTFNF